MERKYIELYRPQLVEEQKDRVLLIWEDHGEDVHHWFDKEAVIHPGVLISQPHTWRHRYLVEESAYFEAINEIEARRGEVIDF